MKIAVKGPRASNKALRGRNAGDKLCAAAKKTPGREPK